MRLNLVTVCTDAYPMEYARKLIKRVTSLSKFDFDCYCITDRPEEIKDLAIPVQALYPGWWNKPTGFSIGINDFTLYMDLDIVILQNFDEEIEYALGWNDHIVLVEDAIGWMGNDLSTSWMVFNRPAFSYISHSFRHEYIRKQLNTFPGGDQVWLGKEVKPAFHKINIKYPYMKKNLKFDLGKKVFDRWEFPELIDTRIKMVDCGGRPKPHQLESLRYIRNNWHNIGA